MTSAIASASMTDGLSENRVLIVDDDGDFAESLADILDSHGYRAVTARNSHMALQQIELFDPQVALIDLRLGVENGTELIERMRAQRPSIVCILMTAYAALDSAVQALRNRADDYLLKPLDPQGVLNVIHDAVCRVREVSLAERRERLASVGSLAAGVAHDLNNVLTIVLNETELIEHQLPDQSQGEDIRAGLHSIRASTLRAAQITRNLLLIARGEPTSTPCKNPREVLEELAATLDRSLPPGAKLLCELQLEGEVQLAIGASQLYQVVLNLLVNARDAIRDNGMVVLRSLAAPMPATTRRRASTPPASDGVLIKVADNGMGIDPVTMQRLFEPFFTTKVKGSGLGLATAYGLVSACGGEMFVDSKLGVGTEFAVWIPCSASTEPLRPSGFVLSDKPERKRDSSGPQKRSQAVLLCDDDPMILHALSRMLRDLGYDVTQARSLNEAWESWQSDPQAMDLVLTDVRLGKERGTELARRVLANRPGTRVVLMSGDLQSVDTRDPVWSKVTHLQKPFNRAALCAALEGKTKTE